MSDKQNLTDVLAFRVALVVLITGVWLGFVAFGIIAQSEEEDEVLVIPPPRAEAELALVNSILVCAAPSPQPNSCGVERWSVKTGTDADVGLVHLNSTTPTTVAVLHGFASPDPTPANNRVSPAETTQWVINGTLLQYKLEDDSDYHLVFQDGSGNTMVTEIPYPGASPACVAGSSPFLPGIANARCEFDGSGLPLATGSFQTANVPVRVTGVGMFDFPHGQTGASPNQIEFHPIQDVVFPKTVNAATATGSNVNVQLDDSALTFTSVSTAGTTARVPIDPSTSGTAPANQTLVGPAYNFSTTAAVTAPINICISAPYITDATAFSKLNILHLEAGTLVNRTTSVSFAQKTICGSLPSLTKVVVSLGTVASSTPTATATATGTPASTSTATATATATNTPTAMPTGTPAEGSTLVLSQVEGGNGTYRFDYVEIKNISDSVQSLTGLSLYYGSAAGNFGAGAFALPNVSLVPGQYYLVQLNGSGTGAVLPVTPDATTTNISMSGASGKIGIVNAAGLPVNTCGSTTTPCSAAQLAQFVDWVAYGAAGNGAAGNGEGGTSVNNGAALTNSQGAVRKNSGCTDTDNNNADFDVVTDPVPRNTATALAPCSAATPTDTPTDTPTATATSTSTSTSTATATSTATSTATATATSAATPPPVISGTVTYGNAIGAPTPRPVSNVTISGAGSPNVSAITAAPGTGAGTYSLTGFGAGSYTVTPTKAGGANSITSFDAAKVAQHAAGTNILTGNALIVADVSGNGSVTSFDAAQIARYAVASPPYGLSGSWIFSPVNRTYPSVTGSITGQDYSALLMGEVSGNWTNTGARPVDGSAITDGPERNVAVGAPQLYTPAGSEVLIPVSVDGADGKGLISYEFDLRYDPAVIQPQARPADLAGTVSSKLSVAVNADESGLLRVAVYGPVPISGSGVLLNLRFTAVGEPGSASPLTWERIMFNEGDSQTPVTDGVVELTAAPPNQAEISGRLLTATRRGIPHARVTLTDTTGERRSILANGFGVYRFGGLQVGQTYMISVEPRRNRFKPLTVSVTDQRFNMDMIAGQ